MNWPGIIFGIALALALLGAAGAAFAQQARHAVCSLSVAMLGIAGVCLTLGNDVIAIVVTVVLAAAVPAAMLAANLLAPIPESDRREGRRGLVVALGVSVAFAALAFLLTRTAWVPAGGAPQTGAPWLASRLLTDHLVTMDLLALLLGLAGVGAVALLRGRGPGR